MNEPRAIFNKSMYYKLIKLGFPEDVARALTHGIIISPFVDIPINFILKKITDPIPIVKDIVASLKK